MLTMITSYNPAYISDQKAQRKTNETGGTTHRDQILDTIVLYTKRWLGAVCGLEACIQNKMGRDEFWCRASFAA